MPVISFAWKHPGAQNVQLAGDFTDWQPVQMDKVSDEYWSLDRDLTTGVYQFKYVVDGNWVHNEDDQKMLNDVGSLNNIVDVKGEEIQEVSPSEILEEEMKAKLSLTEENGVEGDHVTQNGNHDDVKESAIVEVERKFTPPDNFAQLVSSKGFTFESEVNLEDQYMDDEDFNLLRKDFWLRRRNGIWELKFPLQHENTVVRGNTKYCEVQEQDIIDTIRPILKNGKDNLTLSNLDCHVKSFAVLRSTRLSYKRDQVTVTVDSAEWGYKVGEIEVCLTSGESTAKAVQMVEEVAKELGLSENVTTGKMESYLKLYNLEVYNLLAEHHKHVEKQNYDEQIETIHGSLKTDEMMQLENTDVPLKVQLENTDVQLENVEMESQCSDGKLLNENPKSSDVQLENVENEPNSVDAQLKNVETNPKCSDVEENVKMEPKSSDVQSDSDIEVLDEVEEVLVEEPVEAKVAVDPVEAKIAVGDKPNLNESFVTGEDIEVIKEETSEEKPKESLEKAEKRTRELIQDAIKDGVVEEGNEATEEKYSESDDESDQEDFIDEEAKSSSKCVII